MSHDWESVWADAREGNLKGLVDALRAKGAAQERLHEAARVARQQGIGDRSVVRGVIELSNLCRLSCTYCPMRRGRAGRADSYFIEGAALEDAIAALPHEGIDVISFQSGENSRMGDVAISATEFAVRQFGDEREILLCLGKLPAAKYCSLRAAGARSFIMKFETADPQLHAELRGESLDERITHIRQIRNAGFRIGTGSIIGLPGQSIESVARDILFGLSLGTEMLSASPFIPAMNTPLSSSAPGDLDMTLNAIALMRIFSPALTIPAVSALEMLAPGGQLRGLQAGANVVTVNFTPPREARSYSIYGRAKPMVGLYRAFDLIGEAGLQRKCGWDGTHPAPKSEITAASVARKTAGSDESGGSFSTAIAFAS